MIDVSLFSSNDELIFCFYVFFQVDYLMPKRPLCPNCEEHELKQVGDEDAEAIQYICSGATEDDIGMGGCGSLIGEEDYKELLASMAPPKMTVPAAFLNKPASARPSLISPPNSLALRKPVVGSALARPSINGRSPITPTSESNSKPSTPLPWSRPASTTSSTTPSLSSSKPKSKNKKSSMNDDEDEDSSFSSRAGSDNETKGEDDDSHESSSASEEEKESEDGEWDTDEAGAIGMTQEELSQQYNENVKALVSRTN